MQTESHNKDYNEDVERFISCSGKVSGKTNINISKKFFFILWPFLAFGKRYTNIFLYYLVKINPVLENEKTML